MTIARTPGGREVYTMRAADGSQQTNFTRNPASDAYPKWGRGAP